MEKPILFNTLMVQAILEGRKTSTRRIIKPHRKAIIENIWRDKEDRDVVVVYNYNNHIGEKGYIKPIYEVDDILWVRETWNKITIEALDTREELSTTYIYKSDYEGEQPLTWKPSIHMPKVAARIFLKVISIKAERIWNITEEDAIKEGTGKAYYYSIYKNKPKHGEAEDNYIDGFHELWDECYMWPQTWDANPWVWVIEFERVRL